MSSEAQADGEGAEEPGFGVLCALPEELGALARRVRSRRSVVGLELFELELPGARVLACVGGVGKVRAARAATVLLAEGATRGLLVVGVCGGLRRPLVPGELVHCSSAIQADLAVRQDREVAADAGLAGAWRGVQPGHVARFLTSDRPVLSAWRRLRTARAWQGPCVVEMETAAAGRVASAAGVPWAALRAVTDGAGGGGVPAFRKNFPVQAGRAADTVPALLERLGRPGSDRGAVPGG